MKLRSRLRKNAEQLLDRQMLPITHDQQVDRQLQERLLPANQKALQKSQRQSTGTWTLQL